MSDCLSSKLRQIINTLKKLWHYNWKTETKVVYFDKEGNMQTVKKQPKITIRLLEPIKKSYKVQNYGGSQFIAIPKECQGNIIKNKVVEGPYLNVIVEDIEGKSDKINLEELRSRSGVLIIGKGGES